MRRSHVGRQGSFAQRGFAFQRESVNVTSLIILILSSVNTSVCISKLNPINSIIKAPLPHLKVMIYCYYLCSTLRIFRFSLCFVMYVKQCSTVVHALQLVIGLSYLQSLSPVHLLPFLLSSPPLFSLVSHTQSLHIFSFVLILEYSKIYCRNQYNPVN